MIAYRRDIDGLRAVAVLAVVFGHAEIPAFSGGFVGVDIFFVISGFLIGSILLREMQENEFSLIGFYERRARRILPALFAVIATCLVVGWFLFPPPQYEAFGWSAIAATLFVSNFWFQRNAGDYFAADVEFEPLLHTWSLAVEEQFYIVAPLLLLLLFPLGMKWLRSAIILGVAASFLLSVYATTNHPVANFYSSPTRAWELGLGMMFAAWQPRIVNSKLAAELLGLFGALAILFAIAFYDAETDFPGLAALLPAGGALAIIAAGSRHDTVISRFLSLRLMVGIGLISYSLYLWHWPAIVLAREYSGGVDISTRFALYAIAFSFVAAWVSWRYVETPFRGGNRHRFTRPQIFVLSFACGLAIITMSTIIGKSEGMWSRSPELLKPYEEARFRSAESHSCKLSTVPGACVVGDSASGKSVSTLLWGDSHSRALFPAFAEHMERANAVGIMMAAPGCAPVIGIERTGRERTPSCAQFNQHVLARILDEPEIRTVILHARWPLWSTGKRPEGENGNPVHLVALDDRAKRYGDQHGQLLEAGLENLLAELKKTGRDVIILSGVPEMGVNVPQNEILAHYLGIELFAGKPLTEVRERQKAADRILRRIAAKYDAKLIDTAALLCGEVCPARIGGKALYRDDDHLTPTGARLVFERGLAEALSD